MTAEAFAGVAASISESIAAGDFSDGRLPTERELAEQYRLSRSGIRKVLAAIERDGLIVRSVGRGTFVAGSSSELFSENQLDDISPADMNDARLLFEPAVAERAAVQATATDLAEIARCLEQSEKADRKTFDFWDASLHMSIAKATHNDFVVLTYQALNYVRQSEAWSHVKQFAMVPQRLEVSMAAHRRIAESIARRDGLAARAAMQEHIEQVGRYIANRD